MRELLPDLEATTRTLKARVVLNNPQHQLKPGMYLNVQLAEAHQARAVLTIPEEALIATGSSNRVLIADGEGISVRSKRSSGARKMVWSR